MGFEDLQPKYGSKEWIDVVVSKLEEFSIKHGEATPKFVETVISLLKEGKVESAVKSFIWESDKTGFPQKEINVFLESKFKIER